MVITSLFYPALSLYSSSQLKSVSILDTFTFISPSSISGYNAQQDLANLWSGYKSLRVREDGTSRLKCGVGSVVRVERILIQSPLVEDGGALNHQILLSTLNFEKRLEGLLKSRKVPCLKTPNGRCLVLSPLAFWNHDEKALVSDPNILDTLSLSKNVSIAAIPISPEMVLSGRASNEHLGGTDFDFAMYLALTYFFPESDCSATSERTAWLMAVETAATQNAELNFHTQEPTLIALEVSLELSLIIKGTSQVQL